MIISRVIYRWRARVLPVVVALGPTLSLASSDWASAADRLVVTQGSASRGISVQAIRTYVETGSATENLAYYVDPLSPEEAQALRDSFQSPLYVHFLPFSQFLNSPVGETILAQMAIAVQPGLTPPENAAVKALRGALTGAAEDGQITLLELLERYPHSDLVIDQDDFDPAFQKLGMSFQNLLAAVGIEIRFNPDSFQLSEVQDALQALLEPEERYQEPIEQFAAKAGLSPEELNSPTPPSGSVTLSKAEIYQLYQDLKQIEQQRLPEPGIQFDYTHPADP